MSLIDPSNARLDQAIALLRAARSRDALLDAIRDEGCAWTGALRGWAVAVDEHGGFSPSGDAILAPASLARLAAAAAPVAYLDGHLAASLPGSTGRAEGVLVLRMDLHGPGVESSEAPLFPSREAARASLAPLLAVAGLMLEALRLRARVTGVTRARELLIDSIAHDLRNPLNTFAMSAGLLRDDLEGEPIDAAHGVSLIARMERATARMQALIEDLTEASRVDARAVDYNLRDELPSKLIRDAVGAVRTERGPRITFDPGEDRAWVRADRARTLKVLAKLIDFTCKLTGEGGTIHLSCAGDGEVVRFTTRAVGPAGTPLPLPAEGRGGLALLIARGLVEGQGGALTVDDDDGVRLVFTLPVAPRSG